MQFDFQQTTIEIPARVLVGGGGIVAGLVLLIALAGGGSDEAVVVARNGDSLGAPRPSVRAQRRADAPRSPVAAPRRAVQASGARRPASAPQAPVALQVPVASQAPVADAPGSPPKDSQAAPVADAPGSPQVATGKSARPTDAKPVVRRAPHTPVPLEVALQRVGYQPPARVESMRLRREIVRQLEASAQTGIPVPDVPEGKAADVSFCLEQIEAAGEDQRKLAYAVGQQLGLAWKLLASEDEKVRRSGIGVVWFAAGTAADQLKQPKLARDVSLVYHLPNLDAADTRHWKMYSTEMILKQVIGIGMRADDFETTQLAATILRDVARSRSIADVARLRIAQAQYGRGELAAAIDSLEEIDEGDGTGMAGARRYIKDLQAELDKKSGDAEMQ